jgi:hypothetical protein
MVNFWNLERGSKKSRLEKARKLRALQALPTAAEGDRVGRKKGRIVKPKYNLKRANPNGEEI